MTRIGRGLVRAGLLVGCVLGGGSALAAGSDAEPAEILFRQGMDAIHAHDLPRARTLFEASCRLDPRPGALGNLGKVEVELGDLLQGLAHLRQSLPMLDPSDPRRDVVQRTLADAYAKTGHITVQTKAGATVSVDGTARGPAPLADPIDVLPGKRVLEARLGGQVAHREIDVAPGSVTDVALPLPEKAPAPVASEPAVPPTWSPPSMPQASPPAAASGSWWTAPRILGVGLGAGAVVAVGLATYFHAASENASHDVAGARGATGVPQGSCPSAPQGGSCADLRSRLQRISADNAASNVSWGIGGAAAAGSVIAWIAGAASPRASGWVVRPIVGFGEAGVEGQF